MKFSRTFTNKLVSFADQHYTWDSRKMKREGTTSEFDFVAFNHDENTMVCISREKFGIWVSIRRNRAYIKHGFLKTYSEVNEFKKMIKCLG